MPAEPTILVKKSDGTFVRMPLSEVQKMKKSTLNPSASDSSKKPVNVTAKKPFVPDEFSDPFEEIVPFQTGLPSNTSPNNSFVHPVLANNVKKIKEMAGRSIPTKEMPKQTELPKETPIKNILSNKNFSASIARMNDVSAPVQTEVGPIDEIKLFSVTDFRRLSQNPVEAAARLGQKFAAIKSESILWYLDSLAAWKMSPLYQNYISLVAESINNGQRLEIVAQKKENLQIPEIKAVLEMEKSFSI